MLVTEYCAPASSMRNVKETGSEAFALELGLSGSPTAAGPFLREEPSNGRRAPLAKGRAPFGGQSDLSCSGAEEHKPDHAEDQHRQTGGYRQKGKHRRPGLGLTGFGRGFDDLVVSSRCHGALASLDLGKNARKSLWRRVPEATRDPG